MNHKFKGFYKWVLGVQNGYTLVEAIIAIAICGFGLATILGLYGMAIKTEMVSKSIFEQSIEINSIADEINGRLGDSTALTLSEKVDSVLQGKYSGYRLEEIQGDDQSGLYTIKIIHKGKNSAEKYFYIKVSWRSW
ncbi:type IV pilus modification PilV family protein [Acetobacterium tundrae]|uniref:Prepilin-type N-terminal cleavage/methylation domain-containing protein n=1 Tax=Acetobacterium tundrae TaxID=132932 RepID=A0ABR6WNB2_9FIRM|nr:prepilin-type N-terminal cleavage/methylation domain-containing protein [Acetobacterium tundrae]MBC3797839.1 hypothetical protein [Acetobacterium tundrae]